VAEDQSFAEMFAASKQDTGSRRGVRPGEKVSGPIFQLGADTAFISLGGKSEAMIELRELKDDEGILRFGVGDVIEAYVLEAGARGILLTKSINKGSASLAMLAEARVTGMPVEGLVLSVNKGGLEVAVGETRAFCPVSQIDLRFVEKPDAFVGERLKFRVTEVRERNVVLSRRALLEEEQKALAAETRKNLDVGKVVKGKVVGVRDFGAFVDLGGIEGMIPVSELSHTHVGHPSEVVKVGDEVEVEVLRMEPGNPNSPDKAKQKERITLSLRARQEDPWKAVLAEIQEGSRLTGKVVRLQPFGAFVELRPGVDGLIHISALADRRIAHPRDVVQVGQEVLVEVEKVDPVEKRIGLRRISEEQAAEPAQPREGKRAEPTERAPRPRVGQIITGKVERVEPYGVFLGFPGGRGLIPASETGTDRGTDLRKHFPLDQELKAEILEIDASGKIRLSITAAQRSEERADVEAFMRTQKPQGAGKKGFGTFADLLKDKKLL
jgi:small subunit ribosomal protein S1